MAATNPFIANAQVISDGLPALWDKNQTATYDKINKAKTQEITWVDNGAGTGYDFRIPLEVAPAGNFSVVDIAGGVMPEGTGPEYAQMYQSLRQFSMAFDLNIKDIYATDNSTLSKINILQSTVKGAIGNMKRYMNASWFSDMFAGSGSGRGLCALLTSKGTPSGGAATYTLDGEFGANLMLRGMRFEQFSNDLNTLRTSAFTSLPYVTDVNYAANTIKVAGLGAMSPADDDYLAFPAVGSTPALANTLGYFHNTSTSGTMLGLTKANYAGLLPSYVNANGLINQAHGYKLLINIRQRYGVGAIKDLGGIIHPVQAASLGMLNTQQGTFLMEGGALKDITINAFAAEEIPYWGIKHMVDPMQSRKRIDYVLWKNFVKATKKPLDFFKDLNGNMFFQNRDATTARIKMSTYFSLLLIENYTYKTPGMGGFVYGATIPSSLS